MIHEDNCKNILDDPDFSERIDDSPEWIECGTFTDYGFGFRRDTGDHIDYMIAWPVEPIDGSWALLAGAYSIDDEDRDDYCDAEFLGQVLRSCGFSSLEELQDAERWNWVNALTCMVAEKQADTRFEVPNIVRSDEALADAFAAAGVPQEKLGALMDFARNDALTDAGGVGALEGAARTGSEGIDTGVCETGMQEI